MKNFFKKIIKQKKEFKKGQAVLVALTFFMIMSLALIAGATLPTANQIKNSRDLIKSRQSFAAADSVSDDAYYALNKGYTLSSSVTLPFTTSGVSGTAAVTTTSGGETIKSSGVSNGSTRISTLSVSEGAGASFNYGLQVGTGGVTLGSATINGSLYSNGSVYGTQSSTITGSVTVANLSNPTANQSNSSSTPDYNLSFGTTSSTQTIAQSFKVTATSSITEVSLYIEKTGSPSNATVYITADSSGKPSSTSLGSGTLSASLVSSGYSYITVPISPAPTPSLNTTYWIVVTVPSVSSTNYYTLAATNNTYANGASKVESGAYGANGTWSNETPSTADLYFNVYLGGSFGVIAASTGSQYNPITIGGNAWAHEIDYAKVTGTGYCQISNYLMNSSGTSESCNGTKGSDPVAAQFPISSGNITDWESAISSATNVSGGWTYNGNLTINYAGTTTSSLTEVNGNLTLDCSNSPATFGSLYVTGSVDVESGCAFNATTLKAGGNFTVGSGTATVGTTNVVTGTLSVSGGSTLDMKGMMFVNGSVTVSGGGKVQLDSSFGANDGYLISNGNLSISGGGYMTGSGSSGSYIVAITTSSSISAVNINGGAGAVVVEAPNGTATFVGGASANSVAANAIDVDGGSSITYQTGLASLDFTNGPSGSWNVSSYQETSN